VLRLLPLLLLLPACHRGGDENLGLSRAHDWSVDTSALARPGELEKALAVPSAEIARRLGPHRLDATTRLTLASGETRDTLDETFRLEADAAGGTHILHETSHGGGLETILSGGQVYVRPRYGKFVRRSPEGDEVERARDDVQGLLAGYLAVLGRFAARTASAPTSHNGRQAVATRLTLAQTPATFEDSEPAHAWRKSVAVSALEGEIWIDARTGAPLEAKLDARYTAKRGDHPIDVTLAFAARIDAIGAVPAIAAPEGALATPQRARPLVDRETLLDGLALSRPAPSSGGDPGKVAK
jgi:hypothetical protein